MSVVFPTCPASLKQIQHYLKVAEEHDARDVVVSYWARLYALQVGLKLSTQQPDETQLMLALMNWLEQVKKNTEDEAIINEIAAQAHIDNSAHKLFIYADKLDREMNYGKNVVKAFYTCGILYDVLQTFGELTDESVQNRKYAKWKAAYIHNCLKNGETPVPGPLTNENDSNENNDNEEEMQSPSMPDVPTGNDVPAETSPSVDDAPETSPTDEEFILSPDKFPSPPVDDESPGNFKPFVPEAKPELKPFVVPEQIKFKLNDEQMTKAQKYCKYASNSLNYDDVTAAISNLQKALMLLTTGVDS